MTLTKEWLLKTIAELEEERDAVPGIVNEDAAMSLAAMKLALASLEARGRKLFTCSACGAEGLDEPLESKCNCNEDGAHWIESVVYTAPPVPVSVPDEVNVLLNHLEDVLPDDAFNLIDVKTWNNVSMLSRPDVYRAAMLQGAEPVTTANKLGNSPAIPDCYVIVPKDLLSDLRDWAHPEIEKYCEMWEGRRDSEFPALRKVIADADALLAAAPQEVGDA
ncbi:hypothetical protein [Enterobacter hormaechei]|uniref:hypothetical protein n=1 Tax=Enterobacter hormaechei TaxID=158836 RepID=UPI000799365A|nr:hypothetical protein [Enterobacter hormaechei]SAF78770.1 Uncharacterised protein [Enterobacter hormaechei]